ncbi:hypothetical protein C8N25_1319 [Algoriphagus antarcticus]|uniref:Type 1 periplasmic binding fold superfamily protein n=2 Tax=Algoriphagus antarcticus TaxID=238540 RepID=A0A3E0DC46_9BACT|nr:hypothetical protein C8N25_1319 [Algoriphagus antarcticus]
MNSDQFKKQLPILNNPTMFNSRKIFLYAILFAAFTFTACESDDPEPENDGEVITDVILNFQELDASGNPVGAVSSFSASDPQGIEVGATPTIETVELTKGKTYQLNIEVRNSIENEDITEEILEEADEHQFYFLGTAFVGSPILTYQYDDLSGELIGVQGILTVQQNPGFNNANMQIILRHDLDKNYPGASNPNFQEYAMAGGESDLDITFPVVVE